MALRDLLRGQLDTECRRSGQDRARLAREIVQSMDDELVLELDGGDPMGAAVLAGDARSVAVALLAVA